MSRKAHTSQGRRKFYHENQSNVKVNLENNIIRPPTSHPYLGLNNYRVASGMMRTKYQSNYFTGKIIQQNLNKSIEKNNVKKINFNQFEGIPKDFKHLFMQLKVLLKNMVCQQTNFNELLCHFARKIKQIHHQNMENKSSLQIKSRELETVLSTNDKLNLRLHQIQEAKQERKELGSNSSKTQFSLMLQNIRLTQLNESYLTKLKDIQSKITETSVEVKKQAKQNGSETQILRYHNRINYLEMKIKNSQSIQAQMTVKNQALQDEVQELKFKIQEYQEQMTKLKQQRNQWRQRALMQKEDSETNLTRQNFLLFSIKKLRQTNKNLTDKLINLGNTDGVRKTKQIEANPYFQYQIDFFKGLKSVYFQAKHKQFKVNIQSKKDSYQVQCIGLQKQYVEYRKHQQINLTSLSYYKPSFFSFIEQSITNDIYSCRVKGSTSVSRIFIQVLRSIMNCKINQFMVFGKEQKFSRFPEFVYSWFQKFYFNSQKNQVTTLEQYMQKPISQDIFYRDLMNVKLDQSWEIITFREFLLEQLNLQELYFYLMCQNLLFRKAGINNQIQYLGQFCILVEFSSAKAVLDLVLSDFQSWNISFLTSKLRQKIVVKRNIEYIESGFFLRCLIEYYKIQRINRFKYISKLCDEFKSCEQKGLRFSSFISIINRFTQISAEEKVRLYRDCYSVSKGKITADIIFTVCTQQLIFLRYLKMKCFYRVPTIITHQELRKNKSKINKQGEQQKAKAKIQPLCIQPSDPYIYDIFIELNRLLVTDKGFNKRLQTLGVAQLLNHFNNLSKILGDRTIGCDSSMLKGKHFIHFISQSIQKVNEINYQNFYDLLDQNNKKRTNSSFWIEIDQAELCQIFTEQIKTTFNSYNKINEYRLWKEKVYNFRVNNAARKIQRQVRKKFIQPFMQLYKIIYSELKKEDSGPGNARGNNAVTNNQTNSK